MLIFSYGMPKSASTYAFQLSLRLLQRASVSTGFRVLSPKQVLQGGDHEWYLHENIDLDAFAVHALQRIAEDSGTVSLVKTHHRCTAGVQRLINEGKAKAIATFRHPQELALSLIDATRIDVRKGRKRFGLRDIPGTIPAIGRSIDRFKSWLAAPGTFPLLFDELVCEPNHIVCQLAEYFGVDGDPNAVVSYFEKDKQGRIGEFNKGQLNRHLSEFPSEYYALFAKHFAEFQGYVDDKKRDVGKVHDEACPEPGRIRTP